MKRRSDVIETLLQKARQGDRNALDELVNLLRPDVERHVRILLSRYRSYKVLCDPEDVIHTVWEDFLNHYHKFDTGDFVLGMDTHGHAASIVRDFDRAIFMEDDRNASAVACQSFIHAVVDDFLDEMVGAGRVRVHARPALYRFEAGQNFDIRSLVLSRAHFSELLHDGLGRSWT